MEIFKCQIFFILTWGNLEEIIRFSILFVIFEEIKEPIIFSLLPYLGDVSKVLIPLS